MRGSDIEVDMLVKVKGHIGVVKKCNVDGFCGDGMRYMVEFTGNSGLSSVSWWVTADEVDIVRGV